MPRQAIISASTVQECAFRLIVCAGHKSPSIAGGTEDQATASSEHIGAHPSCGERKVEHQVASYLVYVGLYPGQSRIQADIHQVTGDLVFNLPLPTRRVSTYVLAGGGSLIFRPTGNAGGFVPGADNQAKGAFLYGAGADYGLTRHFSLRAEYRGFVYKNPDFGLAALNTDSWTHTPQPSAGIVFRF